ncbi:hypothetical protein C8J56DRAFT_763083, partial [Mycena floridula]
EYDSALTEVFNSIGIMDEMEKVHRLWTGLHDEIQDRLWMEKLNPERSSYQDVVDSAELIEVALNAAKR